MRHKQLHQMRRMLVENLEARLQLSTVGFVTHELFETEANNATSVYAADLDGDGDMDVLSSSHSDEKIAWYENEDGAGAFGSQRVITTHMLGARSVFASDLDGDGDMDVLSASLGNTNVAWYENMDGKGTFGDPQGILTQAEAAFAVYAADVDGDGDEDVLSTSVHWEPVPNRSGNLNTRVSVSRIAWYENVDSKGTFGDQQPITTQARGPRSVYAADVDGDGDIDVLSASEGDHKIAWYENTDGTGDFGEQQVLTTEARRAQSVYATDLDGDGDIDVLSASEDDDKIAWYENTDGKGDFGDQQVITNRAGGAQAVYAADLDGDGDIDVLSASRRDNRIVWYENTDSDGTFVGRRVITSRAGTAKSVYAADLDGDNYIDVLSASLDNKVAWYENTDGQGSYGEQLLLAEIADVTVGTAYVADMDNDGDLDVLSARSSDRKLVWFENADRRGAFQERISQVEHRSLAQPAADIDGDNDLDIVSIIDNVVGWHPNSDGQGTFTDLLPTPFVGLLHFREVHPADPDGDGDMDIFYTGSYVGDAPTIGWYENVNGRGAFVERSAIQLRSGFDFPHVIPTDVDGDNDIDVLYTLTEKIGWYENTDGKGTFGGAKEIAADFGYYGSATIIADVDGDSDVDIITALNGGPSVFATGSIFWYENIDGQGAFGERQLITTELKGPRSLYAADIDRDGDIDMLSASAGDDKIAWYENTDGTGRFGPQQVITTDALGARSVYAADLDGDGDTDVLSASLGDNKLAWYENVLAGDLDGDGKVAENDFLLLAANYGSTESTWEGGDLNGDRVVDFADFLILAANVGLNVET